MSELWREYVAKKQAYKEIAERFSVGESTVKRRSLSVNECFECKSMPHSGVILMDTTCFGRNWDVVVLMSAADGKMLWRKYVKHEKLIDYQDGICFVKSKGYQVSGLVCDGLKGIFKQFSHYSVQMCQRHQIDIVRRYLTRNPKLEAGKELYILVKNVTELSENEFTTSFKEWLEKWNDFLNERTKDAATSKSHYFRTKVHRLLYLKNDFCHFCVLVFLWLLSTTNVVMVGLRSMNLYILSAG